VLLFSLSFPFLELCVPLSLACSIKKNGSPLPASRCPIINHVSFFPFPFFLLLSSIKEKAARGAASFPPFFPLSFTSKYQKEFGLLSFFFPPFSSPRFPFSREYGEKCGLRVKPPFFPFLPADDKVERLFSPFFPFSLLTSSASFTTRWIRRGVESNAFLPWDAPNDIATLFALFFLLFLFPPNSP